MDQFIGRDCFLPTVIMFLGYGLAVASSTYCLSFFFSDHTMAQVRNVFILIDVRTIIISAYAFKLIKIFYSLQNVVLLINFFSGLILMVISFIMGLIKSTVSANSFLKNFFRLSPGFCYADGLASLALLRQGMKDKSSDAAFDWNVTGASICYLGVESICYFLFTLGLELLPSYKEWWSIKSFRRDGSPHLEPLLGSSAEKVALDFDEDSDVAMERNRVYPGGKVAVQSLTFSVQEGECFGFLGTNGAGKTTTLSMLSGEESATDGSAYIFGKSIRTNPKAARQQIGFCPRGGNKRKLSVAIAMIGDPPIVILDEPSTDHAYRCSKDALRV
ncbi:hypothetical protein G4B88_002887 [Cannabis sativa]|uniref:ABC transporter domain-containing protein n=1 Tax=Cannabis sativa TaxID=3483 RepID=A0A7J6GFX8_CANSA|nr:hypothetical protein G4B88_002887 [Cannabis sativa]